MGLDGVELLLDLEEAFGVSITDGEAQSIQTVGQLYELVLSKLPESDACASMIAFNRLRRGLQTSGAPRNRVVRSASLPELLPRPCRRVAWGRLASVSGLKLPKLGRPRWVLPAVVTVSFLAAIAGYQFGLAASISGGVLTAALLAWVSRLLAFELPAGCTTVGDLAAMLAHLYPTLTSSTRPIPSAVWERIVDSIVSIGGIPRGLVTAEARLVDDLAFGA